MSLFQRGDIWWYEFWFAGRRIRESSKSESKTLAKDSGKESSRANLKRASTTSPTLDVNGSVPSARSQTSFLRNTSFGFLSRQPSRSTPSATLSAWLGKRCWWT